jgi:hypothetical protein
LFCLLSLVILFHPSSAAARGEFRNIQDTRFKLSLGGMIARMDTSLLVKPQTGPAALYLDLENDVGLDSTTQAFRLSSFYRVADRHRIFLSHFKFDREADRVIDKVIEIGDNIWQIDAELMTSSKISLTELAYMYSLIQDGRFELAALAGFHWFQYEGKFAGVNNGNQFVEETATLQGPLPVLGVDVSYAVNSRLNLFWRTELFAIEIDKYGGSMTNNYLAIEYFLWRNMGFGLAYTDMNLDVKVDDDKKIGEIDAAVKGLIFFLTVRL